MKQIVAHMISGAVWLFVAGLSITGITYAEDAGVNDMKMIEGSVWYRERKALPPNAEIHVFLKDVARMDVPSEVIATTRIVPEGGPPWVFSLAYDPGKLQDKGRYVVSARIEADGHLMFISTQQIPAFDREAGAPIEILVSRVGERLPGGSTSAPIPDVDLTNTYWKLTEIDGQPATLGAGQRELHMVLTSEGDHVRGFSGCNRFTGDYERNESQLGFRPLASTRMACLEGMEQEQRFLTSLGEVVRFTISGDRPALYSGDERLILRFEAVALFWSSANSTAALGLRVTVFVCHFNDRSCARFCRLRKHANDALWPGLLLSRRRHAENFDARPEQRPRVPDAMCHAQK